MVLLLCAREAELREVLLSDKPASMIEASAKATVPVLCLADGTVLDQSIDIMRWALVQSGDPGKLFDTQPDLQLRLIERNDEEFKYWLDRYKYHVRFPQDSPEHYRQQAMRFICSLEARLADSPYLFGHTPQIADISIMPFVRQFYGVDRDWFEGHVSTVVRQWLNRWLESDSFKQAMVKHTVWQVGQVPVLL